MGFPETCKCCLQGLFRRVHLHGLMGSGVLTVAFSVQALRFRVRRVLAGYWEFCEPNMHNPKSSFYLLMPDPGLEAKSTRFLQRFDRAIVGCCYTSCMLSSSSNTRNNVEAPIRGVFMCVFCQLEPRIRYSNTLSGTTHV